jgi:hypothetical protein
MVCESQAVTCKSGPANRQQSYLKELFTAFDIRVAAMMKAYLDESENAGILTISGYVGHSGQWPRFEREWKNALSEFGFRAFHIVDFAHSKGEFEHLKGREQERQKVLARFMKIIYREPPRLFAFGCSVDLMAFRTLPDQTRQRVGDDPYWLVFQASVGMAVTWLSAFLQEHSAMLDERIAFIFDRRGSQGLTRELYNKLKDVVYPEDVAKLCGMLAFDDDEVVVPLQAADILAYEMAKYLQDEMKGIEKPRRWPMQQIMSKPGRFNMFTKDALEEFFKTAEVHP